MKISMQEKIAELERRIVALEGQRCKQASSPAKGTTTVRTETTTAGGAPLDLEPEWGGLWKSFDAVMAKAFGPRRP